MSEELIDKYIDREAIKKDTDFFLAEVQKIVNGISSVGDIKTIKSTIQSASTPKGIAEAADLGVKANANLVQSIKAVKAVIDQRFASEAKLVTVSTDYNKATVANRLELQKQNKELKDQAAFNAANTGSIEKARAAVALLNNERNKLNLYTKEGQARQKELNEQIDKYNNFIKKSVDSLSAQKINVGNYQGSAKIIVDALEKERQKLLELEKTKVRVQNAGAQFKPGSGPQQRTVVSGFAGGGSVGGLSVAPATKEIENLNAEIEKSRTVIEGFSRITEKPTFLNVAAKAGDATAQLKFFTKALVDLEVGGQGGSDAAKQLRNALAELQDQIGDAKAEVKALSSDTRGFDLFAGSVTFAADAFQTFAGAAVLAGASEEDAAEATKTLVAIQSVANGVKGIANELTTRGTAANKLFAFSQGQIGVAMDTTALASVRLRAALVTIGFGALIVGLGLLIANFGKIKDVLTGATVATKAYDETLGDYRKGAQDAIEKTNQVKVAFEQAKTGVISKDEALATYNETLGDTFGKATSLAEAEKLYNEKAGVYIEIMGLKAQANALFAKSAEEAAKGITAGSEDQISLFDKLKLGIKQQFVGIGGIVNGVVEAQTRGVKEIADKANLTSKALFDEASLLAGKAAQLGKDNAIAPDKKEDKKVTAKKKDDSALKDALEAEKKKNAAIRALAIENANEQIRINQAVIDSDQSSFKQKLAALENVSSEKKKIAAIELATAVESEKNIEAGKLVVTKKGKDEIILAETQNSNKIKAINDELLKGQQAAQKENSDNIIAEYDRIRDEKLKKLDEETQAIRDQQASTLNDNVIALNDQYNKGLISQEKYNEERAKLDYAYQIESLQTEIDYQKKLIEISDLPADKKAEALRRLADLERDLSNATLEHTKKTEEEKLAAITKTFESIKNVSGQVFDFIGGLLNANAESQKNKLKETQDEQEKKAARDIELVNASTLSEQDKAAKVTVINARLQAQKDQNAQKERKINEQQAKFQKAVSIFNIILSTAQAVTTFLAKGNIAGAILAGVAGAAQLAVAIATPIPKYRKGKAAGNNYEGPAIVGDGGKSEVIERADGSIEFTPATDTLAYVGKNDIIHPDKDQWMNAILGAASRDSQSGMRATPGKQQNEVAKAISKQTKLLEQIAAKKELHLGAGDKGMVALWKWGAQQVKYTDQNTNW